MFDIHWEITRIGIIYTAKKKSPLSWTPVQRQM